MRIVSLWTVRLLVCSLLAIASSNAAALVIIIDESIDGDLPKKPVPFDPNLFPNFVLPEGESKAKGDLLAPADPTDNEDWFKFVVPPGMKLPSIEIVIPEPSFDTPALDLDLFELDAFSTVYTWTGGIFEVGTPLKPLETPSENGDPPRGDLGPGLYGIRLKAFDDPPWEVTFNLVAVPEPSTYTLAAFGLLTLGLFGWRRHRRS